MTKQHPQGDAAEHTDATDRSSGEKVVSGEVVGEEPSPTRVTASAPVPAPKREPVAEESVAEESRSGEALSVGETPGAPGEAGDASQEEDLAMKIASLRAELDERTADLLRVTAEYANYRKRVDRDRTLVAEQATGAVLTALLPVLDDLDRAREHGDLVGPFGSVAEQLTAALSKFGLTVFGAKGDPFDPKLHEAVAHLTSTDVTEPSCFDVLRRGYLLGDRLLRAAMVAVADPE